MRRKEQEQLQEFRPRPLQVNLIGSTAGLKAVELTWVDALDPLTLGREIRFRVTGLVREVVERADDQA